MDDFDSLSPEAKRVAIAKDVLCQMGSGKIQAESGSYIEFSVDGRPEGSMSELIQGQSCRACAIGSVFYSAMRRGLVDVPRANMNEYDSGGVYYHTMDHGRRFGGMINRSCGSTRVVLEGSFAVRELRGYFSARQLHDMERAFERWNAKNEFIDVYSDEVRLRLIMENVIRNNGTYVRNDKVMLEAIANETGKPRGR